MRTAAQKILPLEELKRRLAEDRARRARVVFTNGCFDLLHVGHLRYLEAARRQGERLVVAINSDESVRRLKGESRPVLKSDQRMKVLAGLACVDYVTQFEEDTPHRLLEELRPDLLVKGANYPIEGVVGRELVEAYGGRVVTLELTEAKSTTATIEQARGKK